MNIEKMREEFEVWAKEHYVHIPGNPNPLCRDESGEGYRMNNVQHAWLGWGGPPASAERQR